MVTNVFWICLLPDQALFFAFFFQEGEDEEAEEEGDEGE